jgi:hypothetical protein
LRAETAVFLWDKQATAFLNQEGVCCNDTLRVDYWDFIYELKILEATYSDEIKGKGPMVYTCATAVTDKSQDVCRVYLNMTNISSGSSIKLAYAVIVPMTTFNFLARIRYLSHFFGVWTLEIRFHHLFSIGTHNNSTYRFITLWSVFGKEQTS